MADSILEHVDPLRYDLRSVDQLISVALSDPNTYENGGWEAVVALHWRGSAEVLNRAARMCQSNCAVERRVGADILGQLGFAERSFVRERLNVLLKLLRRENDLDVLYSVLIALGHLGETDAIVPVARFRRHPDADIRYGVVYALLGQDDRAALDVLIKLTHDEDAHVRDWATFGLGTMVEQVDTPPLRDALIERLSDSDEIVRSEALIGLARRKDDRVVSALLKELAADSVDVGVIEAAELIADSQLHSALVNLRGRREGDDWILDQALLACSPPPELS
jgi:HEAT repeat protein